MRLPNIISSARKFDWLLFAGVFLLVLFGLAALYSVAQSQDVPDYSNLVKQIVFTVIGFVLLLFFASVDYRQWSRFTWFWYGLAIFLLLVVLVLGQTIRGTRGWLVIGGSQWQVVEAVKFCLIIFTARWLALNARDTDWSKIMQSACLLGIPFLLILLQPDFGSGLVVAGLWSIGLFLSRTKWQHWAILIIIGVIAVTSGWFLLKDYQRARISSFFNPQADPYGSSYNVTQAKIAVGSGMLTGRGLGAGTQSQLRFIPESQTDFIFAVIAEELGFFGTLLILGIYALVFWRITVIAKNSRDDFGLFLSLLIAGLLFIHIIVNIGMNIALLPVTGIALPFVSMGGSFLTVCLALIGLVESVAFQANKIKYA